MARESYTTPTAFYGALKHKAQLVAREDGLPVADVLSSYFFNRLIARVFHTQPDAWLVKGGHALLLRYASGARLSQDIDIQRSPGGGIDEAVNDLLAAAAHDLDDYLSFTPARTSRHENGAAGAKQVFRVHLGTHEVGVVKVDVVTGHPLGQAPDTRRLTPLIDLAWPADWPVVNLYPIVHHLADKICAMYEQHKGAPSSRYRDLADVLLISQREDLDGRYAQLTLRTEARRRRLTGIDLPLPQDFQPPGPTWPERYPAAALQVPGLKGCLTWKEAAEAAKAFITPLLAPGPPGAWSAADAAWHPFPEPNRPVTESRVVQQANAITASARARAATAPAAPPTRPDRAPRPVRPDVHTPDAGPGVTPMR
ncbi:nucleotidyl transferase AbiEii/AbiGii toxin family protein [Streptomyces sp. NBC_00470]|uniref:nucleotidyl transferase AbiEii/AbiGii toxin family protein n=1 Tax=Streptomyces sp. NBC_00470 TaxID=2975753 RepID=UPI002F912153